MCDPALTLTHGRCAVIGRLQAFLPELERANEELAAKGGQPQDAFQLEQLTDSIGLEIATRVHALTPSDIREAGAQTSSGSLDGSVDSADLDRAKDAPEIHMVRCDSRFDLAALLLEAALYCAGAGAHVWGA